MLEELVDLRVELSNQIGDMSRRGFQYSRIAQACNQVSTLTNKLKMLGGNMPSAVQELLPKLVKQLKQYVEAVQDLRGYYGGIVDLPEKEQRLVDYISSYADDLSDLSKIKLSKPKSEAKLLGDLAKQKLEVKELKEKLISAECRRADSEAEVKYLDYELAKYKEKGIELSISEDVHNLKEYVMLEMRHRGIVAKAYFITKPTYDPVNNCRKVTVTWGSDPFGDVTYRRLNLPD